MQTLSGSEVSLHLSPNSEEDLHDHLEILDDAIDKAGAGALGRCYVCQGSVETDLLEIDYTACICLEHFSETELRQLQDDLDLAQNVQKMLMPQEVPHLPGVEFAAFTRPAQIFGKDYFDFLTFGNGALAFTIADVAGHGVYAGLHMASIQSLLRALVPEEISPAEVTRRLNKLFIHNINFTTFVSLFLAALDPSSKTLRFCNAGQNSPLVLREGHQQNEDALLHPTGPAIGLVEGAVYEEEQVMLASGDLIVLYSDGVTEAVNPQDEEFGLKRLHQLVERSVYHSAGERIKILKADFEAFTASRNMADDLTIVTCKIL